MELVIIMQKNKIDWTAREKELQDILNKYRSRDGSYDVLIQVVEVRTVYTPFY